MLMTCPTLSIDTNTSYTHANDLSYTELYIPILVVPMLITCLIVSIDTNTSYTHANDLCFTYSCDLL